MFIASWTTRWRQSFANQSVLPKVALPQMSEMSEAATATPSGPLSWPRRMLSRMEIDRAVFFAIIQRVWQLLAGPVTLILIGRFFSPEMRDFYYTFLFILGLQTFFELAIPPTLIVTASHLWGKLQLNDRLEIEGDPDAHASLYHLTQLSLWVFVCVSTIFFVVVSTLGWWFFATSPNASSVNWHAPWIALMVATSIAFALTPLFSILEGCNRTADIFQLQFSRSVIGNIVVWTCIPLGFGLWLPAISTLVRILCDCWMLIFRYGRFFASMKLSTSKARIDWWRDIWPFQSRVVLKGMFFYLNSDLMVPVLKYYGTTGQAGQLGMTLQVLSAVRNICSSWVRARYAQMGTLVSQGKHSQLDTMFARLASIGAMVMAALCATYLVGLIGLNHFAPHWGQILLPTAPTVLLLIGLQSALVCEYIWTYVHSYRISPQLALTLFATFLSGALIWWWGAYLGPLGVTAAYCAVQTGVYLPMSIWTWRHLKKNRDNPVIEMNAGDDLVRP